MPLSDHEQRMLDEIETALYAEDPKFASSVRGGSLRTPTTRRRLQGMALFGAGLVMLVAGIPLFGMINHAFLLVSILGFMVMFGGALFGVTGSRLTGGRGSAGAPASTATSPRRAKGAGSSFASRMEDRFRRRFDN